MAILKSSDYRMQAVNILLRINQDKLKHVHQPFGQLEYVFVSKKEELVLCKYSLIFFLVACSSVHHLTHPCIINMKAIIYGNISSANHSFVKTLTLLLYYMPAV